MADIKELLLDVLHGFKKNVHGNRCLFIRNVYGMGNSICIVDNIWSN